MNRKDPLASIPVPDWVLDPITAYGDARATVDGPHDLAALELNDTITALRRWAMEIRSESAEVPEARAVLIASFHALQSYAHGNAAPDLALGLATRIASLLGGVPGMPGRLGIDGADA